MITEDEAVAIARQAIEGKITPEEDAPIRVEWADNQVIVTFEVINPPGVRGPDFSAQVTIDAYTGEVLEILAGAD